MKLKLHIQLLSKQAKQMDKVTMRTLQLLLLMFLKQINFLVEQSIALWLLIILDQLATMMVVLST